MISLDVHSDTSELEFNLHPTLKLSHMVISSSDMKSTASQVLPSSTLSTNEEQERAIINLASLPGGGLKRGSKDVKVWFRFGADLVGGMSGYYKSEGDVDDEGKMPL